MYARIAAVLCVAMLVVGCGDRKPPEKTVFDPLLQSKQKARDVEKTLQQGAERRDEQIRKEEQGEKD